MAIRGAGIMVAYLTMAAKLSGSQAQAAETGKADAIAASETKSAYLAFMSHKLRTPLTGVLDMAEALQARPDGADRDAQLEVLIRSSRGMLSMLNDLLDIAKIEAGRLELERTAVNARIEVESVAMLWAEAARGKSVAMVCDLDASAEVTVASHPTRLRQILNNLVCNMPRMNGFEALAVLRKSSSTAHIPVVAISADVSAATERSKAQAGFAALASKPIELQTLLATLGEVLGSAKQDLELETAAHG